MNEPFDTAVLYKRFLLLGNHTAERRVQIVEAYDESVRTVSMMTSMPLDEVHELVHDEARRLNGAVDALSKLNDAEAAEYVELDEYAELIDEPEDDLTALAEQARDAAGRATAHGDGASETVSLAYAVTVLADALDIAAALLGQHREGVALEAAEIDDPRLARIEDRIDALEGSARHTADRLDRLARRLDEQ